MTDTEYPEFWIEMSAKRKKRNDAALALYAAAETWRKEYFRTRPDPMEIRTDRDQLVYDMHLTDYGDEAYNLLMDYTEPLD